MFYQLIQLLAFFNRCLDLELDFSDLRNVHSIMHKMSSSTADALTDVVAKAVFDR